MNYTPHLLPKVRSDRIMATIRGDWPGMVQPFPCTARISSLVPGHRCASRSTVCGCHLEGHGKAMASKTSDLPILAGCFNCHNLIDYRDKRMFDLEGDVRTARELRRRITHGIGETLVMLILTGAVSVEDGELI